MLEVERFEKIMEYLREKKTAPVNVLAKRLFVSEATMRRDLSELERKGLVKRLHGGAILLDGANQELPLYLRERQNTDAKRKSLPPYRGRPDNVPRCFFDCTISD